jgi:hypothetical protein
MAAAAIIKFSQSVPEKFQPRATLHKRIDKFDIQRELNVK